jgi:hypothetical protein
MEQILLNFDQYIRLWIHHESILTSRSDCDSWIVKTFQDAMQIEMQIQCDYPIYHTDLHSNVWMTVFHSHCDPLELLEERHL